ncbi:DUF58 domain-containing protein [Chloroflexus sp.]|uniref:DUF58 domain-containing protein n=1 Tax=Chloroflexus sp. TaxID=1904827 RepID=UPI002618170E|nr:DUF58 domain-containing protein [uncultured Chloroflexus sp.]
MSFLRLATIIALIWQIFAPHPALGLALYVLIGIQLVAWFGPQIARRQIEWQRQTPAVLAPNESGEVVITITYQGRMPLPYVIVSEDIPPALSHAARKRWVISLKRGQPHTLRYAVQGRQRGLYWLGPLRIVIGSVLDRAEVQITEQQQIPLIISPPILPLPFLNLPAGLSFSQERRFSLFDDPAQKVGVRPYRSGDPPRRIDWKTSARLGALQVRELAPAIGRETLIALEMSETAYRGRFARDDRERAIIAAASLATALINQRQAVGLRSNGYDPLTAAPMVSLPPATGLDQLRAILAQLGRIEPVAEGDLLADVITAELALAWGGTLVVIMNAIDERRLTSLVHLARGHLRVAVALTDPGPTDLVHTRSYGIGAYRIDRNGVIVPVM